MKIINPNEKIPLLDLRNSNKITPGTNLLSDDLMSSTDTFLHNPGYPLEEEAR